MNRVVRFRLRPTPAQARALARQAGFRRWVYNWGLERRKAYFKEHGKGMPKGLLSKELTELKKTTELAWLKEADSQSLQQALADLDRAFVNFFAGRGKFPRFKSKKTDGARFRLPQRVRVVGKYISVPKVGLVRFRNSRGEIGPTKSASFKQDARGNWDVSFVQDFSPVRPLAEFGKSVGIDLGLTTYATLSDGSSVANPRFLRKGLVRLRKAQRSLSRKQKGSNRRLKAKRRLASLHAKVANQRLDFIHKTTTEIVRKYGVICLEDLCVKGMARTKLSKSIADAGLGEFRRQVQYKSDWYGKRCVVIDRWFPSSKLCSACGVIRGELELSARSWQCVCGVVHDRDGNAAQNILMEGLRLMSVGG